eukprot:9011828-Heterocapsa_arctica.AAC.1
MSFVSHKAEAAKKQSRDLPQVSITLPAPLSYSKPDGWDPASFIALHLYMLRFGYGSLRGCDRTSIYEDVCRFAKENGLAPWPARFGQTRTSAIKSTSS